MHRVHIPHRRGAAWVLRWTAVPTALAMLVAAAPMSATAQVQPAPEGLQQQNQIQQQQEERLRQQQERALPQRPPQPGTDLKSLVPPVQVPPLGAACHDVTELRIEGAAHLADATRASLARAFTGRCLGVHELEALLGALTRDYIERGFVTTRVYLPPQDLRTGVVRLRVVEGTIERYELAQVGAPREGAWMRGAFPARPGELLNLRDLEQGLDQLNQLQSNHATLDLQPGAAPGESVVIVRNRAERPVHLYVSYDNLGTPATGRNDVAATVSFDGELGFNELIAVTRSETVPQGGGHHAASTGLQVAVPYGYASFGFDASGSDYTNALSLPSGLPLLANGHTTSLGLTASRVLLRNQSSRLSVAGRLGRYDTSNALGGQELAASSRKLATLELSASGFTPVAGGMGNARLGYVRGLRALGALADAAGLPPDYPRAQFSKFTLDLGYQRRLELAGQPLQWTSLVSAQYSRDPLFGSQQFLIGSPRTVRGSRSNSLSGDDGILLRNDLAWPWVVGLGGRPLAGSLYAGYDYGRTRNRFAGQPEGSMAAATVGATASWRHANAEVFASRALHLPAFMRHEGTLYGVRVAYSF
jgi:hemolysin activation/secretion protein